MNEADSDVGKEVGDQDAPRTGDSHGQQNGSCQPDEENLSAQSDTV